MSRYNKSSNPFEEEEDFVYVPRDESKNPFESSSRQKLAQMISSSEERQLESTQRALASIYDSEAMGTATAEELLRQKEVLGNIEKKTDEVISTLTTSQRHLNNIKSVFGGIKNWWGSKKEPSVPQVPERKSSSLEKFVPNKSDTGLPTSSGNDWGKSTGGYSDGDLNSKFMANSTRFGSSSLQFVEPITHSAREEELDRNLGLMSNGMERLKELARGLGEEIDQQNEQLDRLNPKVDRANILLDNQNKQMYKILGKKVDDKK